MYHHIYPEDRGSRILLNTSTFILDLTVLKFQKTGSPANYIKSEIIFAHTALKYSPYKEMCLLKIIHRSE
jgi:hypothetical protein